MITTLSFIKEQIHSTRCLLAINILILSSSFSYAQTTITWTGFVSSDWHNTANWSPSTIPTAMDSVVINALLSEPNPVIFSGSTAEANAITINSGGLLIVQGAADLRIMASDHSGILIKGEFINQGATRLAEGDNISISADGILTNSGIISIFSNADYAIDVTTDATLVNLPCGNFQLFGPINNNGTILNDGLFGLISSLPNIYGAFTNNGFIEADKITIPPAAITNNGTIAELKTFLTSDSDTIFNAFTVGGAPLYTITGIFYDFEQTMPAGMYDGTNNSFITNSDFPFGITFLNVVISDITNGCVRVARWRIDKRCDFTPVTFTDKIWNVDGPDSLWSNPYNWCPYGVPQTGEQIELPESSVVYYDYTGPEIINNLNNRGSLTVRAGHNLRIANQTDRSLFFNYGIIENFGQISLSNGNRRGLLNFPDAIFHNYGDLAIDDIAITFQNFQACISNRGDFINHTDASISLTNSKGFGFINDPDASFVNQSGASLIINNVDSTGMQLESNSFFENMSGGIIELDNITNPSDKILIEEGAEVIMHPALEIKN